jgi:hypothetical protein
MRSLPLPRSLPVPRWLRSRPGLTKAALLVSSLGFFLVALTGCDNECGFDTRCNGDNFEVCGEGPDQMFHRRVHSSPCAAPNTACVEVRGEAACVAAPRTACDATFEPRCEGANAVSCASVGYEMLTSCDTDVQHCILAVRGEEPVAACVLASDTRCDATTKGQCADEIAVSCDPRLGYLVGVDCAKDEPSTCNVSSDETYAACRRTTSSP